MSHHHFILGDTRGAEDPNTGLALNKHMWHVHHIRYSHRHMKSLGDISMFSRIVILTLDHNYLESIDELVNCRQLIKLDIHSNQVRSETSHFIFILFGRAATQFDMILTFAIYFSFAHLQSTYYYRAVHLIQTPGDLPNLC